MFRPIDKFYEQRGHVWVSPGLTPIMGSRKNPAPHPALPAEEYNPETRSSYVIPQGTMVGRLDGFLVPATPTGWTATFGGQDVFAGVMLPTGEKVKIGDTYNFAYRQPVGAVIWDILQNPMTLPNDFQTHLTQTQPTIRTQGVIVLPIVFRNKGAAEMNEYVKACYGFLVGESVSVDYDYQHEMTGGMSHVPTARPGGIRRFVHEEITLSAPYGGNPNVDPSVIPADNMDFRIGRVIAVEIEQQFSRQGLETIRGDGVNVQSDSTHGFPRHIWNAFKDTRTDATFRGDYNRFIVYVNLDIR